MDAIIIKADSESNKILYKLAIQLGGTVFSLNKNHFEDFNLGIMMNKLKTNQIVSRRVILKKLNKK